MEHKLFSGVILGLILVGGVAAYAFWEHPTRENTDNTDGSVSEAAVLEFTEAMRDKVIVEIGQPIEGFEPFMFMRVYPGLTAQDFNNVDALIGLYRYQDGPSRQGEAEAGEVVYDLNGEVETHSAARAISDEGMEQLFANILARVTLLAGSDPVEGVLNAISAAPGPDPTSGNQSGTEITLTGTIVCLPHKGDGPHTMECAYGLKADNGKHYGLKNLFDPARSWPLDVTDRVKVTGKLISSDDLHLQYDIVGTIDVTSAQKI